MDEETLERKETEPDEEVRRWLKELKLSEKDEEQWRKDAEEAIKVYRSEHFIGAQNEQRKDTFNILWANTETQRPALYSTTPRPDIRKRYKDKNPLAKHISELLERASSFCLDDDSFEDGMIAAVNDMLVPGRSVTFVNYIPDLDEEDNITSQRIEYEQVQWDDFRRGPGKRWADVPWIARRHKFTREEMETFAPDFADKVKYSLDSDSDKSKEDKDPETVFKRAVVWAIWDKEDRQVKYLAPSYKDSLIKKNDDPYGLEGFFPMPRPMYPVESSTSLVPVTEYSMYETLAKELEIVTNRIRKLVSGIRVRGAYDATLSELAKLFDAGDNMMIPAADISRIYEMGGIEKGIWMLPIGEMSGTLQQLYEYRERLIGQIYEITGISDILRGNTDPGETLGAQQIKANFGSQRLQRKQREVQRYARDLLRITVELIGEHFTPETLSQMTGLQFPTQEEKMMAQMQMQQMQMMQQEPDPQMMKMMELPTWEELQEVMQSDDMRAYNINIETDSTIEADQQADQQAISELMTAMGSFMAGLTPAVQAGAISMESGKKLLTSVVRRFRFGREVEDALDQEEDQPQQNNAQQAEQQAAQMELQAQQQQMQADMQKAQMDGQIAQQEAQAKQAMIQLEAQKAAREAEYSALEHQQKMRELELKRLASEEAHKQKMEQLKHERKAQNTNQH